MRVDLKLLYTFLISVLLGLILLILAIATQVQAASDDGFGRLFSSRHERNHLDNLRKNQHLKTVISHDRQVSENNALVDTARQLDPIMLQGYVKRNDGSKSTLWINNQAVQEDSTVGNVQIGRLGQGDFSKKSANADKNIDGVDIKITANSTKVRLKAGQMYEPRTNQIVEPKILKKAKLLKLDEMRVIEAGDEKSQY